LGGIFLRNITVSKGKRTKEKFLQYRMHEAGNRNMDIEFFKKNFP